MNRKYLIILTALITMILFASTLMIQRVLTNNLYALMTNEVTRNLDTIASLMTNEIRNELLLSDLRTARVKLGANVTKDIILGYQIFRDGELIDSVDYSGNQPSVEISKDIRFSDGGAIWGNILYKFPTDVSAKTLFSLRPALRINFLLVIVSIVSIVGIAFLIVYITASKIEPILDQFIVENRYYNNSPLLSFVWNPLLNALDNSMVRYDTLRKENEINQESAAIGRVISQISHDLRTPLYNIESLLYVHPNTPFGEVIPKIKQGLYRIESMINSLRRADLESVVNVRKVNITFDLTSTGLLSKAVEMAKEIEVHNSLSEKLIKIDPDKFERTWINLVSNALDFCRTKVVLEARIDESDFLLRVIDDGPGVPEKFIPKLFQRGSTHGKSDGTGLGLAYVKQVMMGHGGDVRYYRENNLTVFECFIPHAFESKPSASIVKAHVEPVIKVPPRRNIGIAFKSHSLCSEILDRLIGVKAESMLWHEGFDQSYDFIITDDPNIVDKCVDEGISVAQFKPDTPASEIVRRTLIRLGIPQIERTEDV